MTAKTGKHSEYIQSRRHGGAWVGLAPTKQSSKLPKLKREALQISEVIVNF